MKLHSYTDLITNSSQTMFVVKNANVKDIQNLIDTLGKPFNYDACAYRQRYEDVLILLPTFDMSEYEVDIAYLLGKHGYDMNMHPEYHEYLQDEF